MNYKFSDRISSLQPSAIREILKSTSDPSVISFAAGNPAPEAFPIDEVREITADILKNSPVTALQYGLTEGYPPLVEAIKSLMKTSHSITESDAVLITCGAQQVMDLSTKTLINSGDTVICESPSFIGSLNCFRSYNAKLLGVPLEKDGMDIDALEKALKSDSGVKAIYTIPNFQNPSGVVMSLEKRKAVYSLADKYGIIIIEDNPYGETRFRGEDIPSIKSFDKKGIVVYAGSFSKILSPGMRVGFTVAPKEIINKMTVGKQTSDVHTTMLNQMIVHKWLTEYDYKGHIQKIKEVYRRKSNLMCDLIEEHLGDFVEYDKPEGGLFIWCRIPDKIDVSKFCRDAIENKVAVVPGNAFLTDETDHCQYVRLNFSTPTDEQIRKGIEILGHISKKY